MENENMIAAEDENLPVDSDENISTANTQLKSSSEI
jgi:hypothetical protein